MSDATSLLLRLEMEKVEGLKDRWRELGEFIRDEHLSEVGSHFFFDTHILLGLVFGEVGSEAVDKFDKDFVDNQLEGSWNDQVSREVGQTVMRAIKEGPMLPPP